APLAMRIEERIDGRVDSGLGERNNDELALPILIARFGPVLHGTAAADPEVRADRRDALRARRFDTQELAPVRMTGDGGNLDHLPRQRVGHETRSRLRMSNTVAAMAKVCDGKPLDHMASAIAPGTGAKHPMTRAGPRSRSPLAGTHVA